MDEKKRTDDESEQGGPLGQLVEDELAGPADNTDADESPEPKPFDAARRRPKTDTPPSTGRADYARGTAEHDDDREE